MHHHLYGNLLVQPADPDYWSPVGRELVLTVDDLLVEDGKVAEITAFPADLFPAFDLPATL